MSNIKKLLAKASFAAATLFGGISHASELPPEPASISQEGKGFTYDGDNKLNGFYLAGESGLKIVQGNVSDILDPNKKYRNKSCPDLVHYDFQVNDGRMSSLEKFSTDSEKKERHAYVETISSNINMILGEKQAVFVLKNSIIAQNTINRKSSIHDHLDGAKFLFETQTDVLNFQQWLQDSINTVLEQKTGSPADKRLAIETLGCALVASQSPLLKILPNPDNVKPLTGMTKKTSEKVQSIIKNLNNYSGTYVHFKGLQKKLSPLEKRRIQLTSINDDF